MIERLLMPWRRRVGVATLALAVVATACGDGDDPADATSAQTVATAPSSDVTADDPAAGVDLTEAFEAAGITIIDDPAVVVDVDGFQLWSFQVENMQREIAVGDGLFGAELDRAVGAPSGMPFSYLVAGWITGAGTPAAAAAAEIMGEQPWDFAPSVIFPNSVLVLMVADSLRADGVIGRRAMGSPTVLADGALLDVNLERTSEIVAQEGACSRLQNWVDGLIKRIFNGLKIDVAGDEWYAWAARIWNAAVNWAEGKVRWAIKKVTDAILAPIRAALAGIGSVSMVVTHLKLWTAEIVVMTGGAELAQGGATEELELAFVRVDTGLPNPWPDIVQDCATVAGASLPDPSKTTGSKVEWEFVNAQPTFLADSAHAVEADSLIGADNTATLLWGPGRDDPGLGFPGHLYLTVSVEKNQIEKLKKLLVEFFTDAISDAGEGLIPDEAVEAAGLVNKLLLPSGEEAAQEIDKLLAVTSRVRIPVEFHQERGWEYPGIPPVEPEVQTFPASRFEPDVPLKITYEYIVGDNYIEGDYPVKVYVVAWADDTLSKTALGYDWRWWDPGESDISDWRVVVGPGLGFECDMLAGPRCYDANTAIASYDRNAFLNDTFGAIPYYRGPIPAFVIDETTRTIAGRDVVCGFGEDDLFGQVRLCVEEATGAVLFLWTKARCEDPDRTDRSCVIVEAREVGTPSEADFAFHGG